MTDIPALDRAVNEAAKRMGERLRDIKKACDGDDNSLSSEARALLSALDARAAADRPKPLTVDEAWMVWAAAPTPFNPADNPMNAEERASMQAVLTACRERDLKVIEAELKAQPITSVLIRSAMDIVRRALSAGGEE